MRILFDENMPISLAKLLVGHECNSVIRLGWQGTRNGNLLSKAEAAGFQALITLDADMVSEINITSRQIAILVLAPSGQGRKAVNDLASQVEEALSKLNAGTVTIIKHSDSN